MIDRLTLKPLRSNLWSSINRPIAKRVADFSSRFFVAGFDFSAFLP
jgi:hypothetical protein